MAKEVEAKILGIDPQKIRRVLKQNRAKNVLPRNKQLNWFYNNKETSKHGTIRLRKDRAGWAIAIKSELKVVRGHKV